MRRAFLSGLFIIVNVFAAAETPKLNIKLVHDSQAEQQTKAQIERLAAQYDLKKYTVTRDINIEQGVIPHSSPVLTLNARFLPPSVKGEESDAARDQFADDLQLSSYLHEQGHWVLFSRHRRDMPDIYNDLKRLFPNLPTAVPEGDGEERSTYFHIVVIALEWRGTEDLLGADRARNVIDWKKDDHYKAIYRVVEDHRDQVEQVMKRYGLKW